jgi:chemotaxis protein MotB
MDRRILKPLIISLFTLPSTAFAQDYSVLSCDGLKPVIIEASPEMDGLSVYMLDEKLVGTAQDDGSWFVMNDGIAAQFDGQNIRVLVGSKANSYPCSEVDEAVANAAIELAKQLAHRAIASERELAELNRAYIADAASLNENIRSLKARILVLERTFKISPEKIADLRVSVATLTTDLNAAMALVAAQKAELSQVRTAATQHRKAVYEDYKLEFFGRMLEALVDIEGLQIEGDRFVFDSAVLFESGSATVSFAGANEIKAVADTLIPISQEISPEIEWVIQVDGHTDNVPITAGPFENNWELSQARALSVVRMLALLGIPPERLSANGFGEHQPVDTADTPEARARNRRIELRLLER